MSTPIAVLISDVHFTPNTLHEASVSFTTALRHAERLCVPLIDCGDVLDTKAILRAECVNALVTILEEAETNIYFINGNHTLINEKGWQSSLKFLKAFPLVGLIEFTDTIRLDSEVVTVIPYQNSSEHLQDLLACVPETSIILCHQGVQTANMGHYVQDKTSLPPEAFADYRVISGHYHRAQDIQCGPKGDNNVGTFTYVGNPYTLSFGEAQDPPKGYAILMSDGSLVRVPLTNLRKHVVLERHVDDLINPQVSPEDLVWVKLRGPGLKLKNINKLELGMKLIGHSNYKLDKIPTDAETAEELIVKPRTAWETLDALIDQKHDSLEDKASLKKLAREVLNETTNG